MSDQRWSSRCTLSDSKHNNEIASLNFRTGWSVGEHTFAWSSKHTLPRLARSTLNELQQNQHEKASLVCVRVQSPSGLTLVPCALSMVDQSGQLRCWITHTTTQPHNHTHKHPWYRIMFCFLLLAPYARTTRYELAFFPWLRVDIKGACFATYTCFLPPTTLGWPGLQWVYAQSERTCLHNKREGCRYCAVLLACEVWYCVWR